MGNTVRAPHNHRDQSIPKCPLVRRQGSHRMGGRQGGPVTGPVLSHPVLDPWSSSRQPASDTQFMYTKNEMCLHSQLKTTHGDITLQILPTMHSSECCDYTIVTTGVRHATRQFSGVARGVEQWRPSIPPPPNFKRPISVQHVLCNIFC